VGPALPGAEGEDPPPGFELPEDESGPVGPGDPAYQSRKCKVANLIHAQNVAIVEKIVASGFLTFVAETYGELLTEVQLTVWTYLIGELATPWPLIDGILAVAIAWTTNVFNQLLGDTDMAALLAALNDNEQDLVCAIYNSTNAIQATNDYLQVLQDNGVSIGNQEVVLAIMIPRLVNLAFFREAQQEEIENAITNFVGPIDCLVCGPCPVFYGGSSNWGGWSSVDQSTNSGSSEGSITDGLEYRVTIAASPSGSTIARRDFLVPLSEVIAAGWVPGVGASISVGIDGNGPGVVGHGIEVEYVTDPLQVGGGVVLADGFGESVLVLNSDDEVAEIRIVAANNRTSGSGTSDNTGKFTDVTFCNA